MTLEFCLQGVAVPSTVMINASIRRSSSHLPFMSVWSFLPLMSVWSYKTILIEWSCKRNRFSAKSGNFPIVQISNILTPQHSLLWMEGMGYACNLLLFVFQKPSWNHIGLLSFGYRLITWARSCNLPSRMPIKGTWGRKKGTVSKLGQWRLKLSLFWNY